MNKLLIGALLSAIVHCSCTHYYYVANVQNIPMLQEKKDLYVSGFMGVGDGSQSIELQTAYAAGEKIGVMADFMTAWRGKVSNNNYKRGTYFDGAIGYFKPLSETLVFEIYGGVGISSQRHEYEQIDVWSGAVRYEGSSELSSVKFFIQPSLGFKIQPLLKLTKPGFPFEIALSARTCSLSYTRLINNSTFEDLDHINEKKHYFIEPALTMRMGGENIKMQFQFSFSAYLGNPSLYFWYEEVHLSGGVVFNIPPKKNINTVQTPNEDQLLQLK